MIRCDILSETLEVHQNKRISQSVELNIKPTQSNHLPFYKSTTLQVIKGYMINLEKKTRI